ncbi:MULTISPECIES: hypothetical protein [unclassified Streptomyces]|uniref:hypothetical protein n=1 Tax=unclassified Streptomyces TaxID=2593676 RepID=UPI00340E69E8
MWFAGQHHLVEVDGWRDPLPVTVRGVISQSSAINDDLTMRNLPDSGCLHQ